MCGYGETNVGAELHVVSWHDVETECSRIVHRSRDRRVSAVYGVPRGGCAAAAIVAHALKMPLLDDITEAGSDVLIIDDLVDSGATARRFIGNALMGLGAGRVVYFDALFRKPHSPRNIAADASERDGWLVFPWERGGADEAGPADAVVRLLEHIGEDPTREGLHDTPARVLRALTEMTEGYHVDIKALLTRTFESDGYGGMVIVRDVDFVSLCEHHMLPFTGRAAVAYIPGNGRVVGLSKLARLVDAFARRLQVQERMTEQLADALVQHLEPEGVGVVVVAQHSCMSCRGARKADARMVTSSLRGALYDKPEARAEFMRLVDSTV